MIPFDPKMTLEKALVDSPDFKRAYDEEEIAHSLIDTAKQLEGVSRQAGVHAAGVVISDRDLTDYVPLTKDDHDGIVTQYSMEPLGELGLLKMDFLGLKTLTVIEDALKLIEKSTGKKIRPLDIPLDDPAAYELMSRAQNIGLFQVESGGMCGACRQIQPRCVEDIIAIGALFRPGPMEFIPLYAKRKSGEVETEYDHPLLEPILKETYGIMVYQEQVMQAAQILAGYTLGGADMLRRAMGKKKPEEMAKQRAIFVKGCADKNQIGETKANQLFDVLDKFAGYGFNKAHAACYGVITCQTAWLKARHPVEFMAALLSNELDNTDKIALFIDEAKKMGIKVLGPSVNASGSVFTVAPGEIRFGLAAIKNVGSAAVAEIIAAREEGRAVPRHARPRPARRVARHEQEAGREPGEGRRVRRLRLEPCRASRADRRRPRAGQRQRPRPRCRPGFAARHARADGARREEVRQQRQARHGAPTSPCRSDSAMRRSSSASTSPAIRSTTTPPTSPPSRSTPWRNCASRATASTRACAAWSARSRCA